jgi:NADH dehydrogenase [ubiquinone] 1 alpha subcomplex assembly factor 7
MTVRNYLLDYIRSKGYARVDKFMEIAMSAHSNSYYRGKNPLDFDSSDFITSPEVSQMFGEMIGIWIYSQYKMSTIKNSESISILEMGAGTGKLMRDILSVIKKTDLYNKVDLYILEINEKLIRIQGETLKDSKIRWIKDLSDLAHQPTFFIGNEFLDALPIRQYCLEKKRWKEIVIRSDPDLVKLFWDKIEVEDHFDEYLKLTYKNTKDGAFIEESEITIDYIKQISEFINLHGGFGLFIDYAYDFEPNERSTGQFSSTLQSIYKHKFNPVLERIGDADITAHVDFNKIRKVLESSFCKSSKSISQRDFLKSLGIELRLNELIKSNPDLSQILRNQYNRLTQKNHMGELFKVIAFSRRNESLFIHECR